LKTITDEEFQKIRSYIKKNFGINLSDGKKSLVVTRLRLVLESNGFNNFSDYYDFLVNDKSGSAITEFINKITTNHTYFMRETEHFDHLKEKALPEVYENFSRKKDLRLWCAVSSSGEEPYTLQMIIEDFFADKHGWNTQSLATDISTTVLDKAVSGIYSTASVQGLPSAWQKKYFEKYDDENSIVVSSLKAKVMFRRLNLMDEVFPFKNKFHVIFCRNVMIYFDEPTKNQLIRKIYNVLEPSGFLYLGHSETIGQAGEGFQYIMPSVYKKK
jgi:chemotaxis protein methyltransferase CheR